eukprot:7025822-Pyramimonas_sp.AAC.1
MPKERLKDAPKRPTSPQNHEQLLLFRLFASNGHSRPQDSSKIAQESPKRGTGSPKTAPRAPESAPKALPNRRLGG